jgi:hypothetical protein
MQLRHAHSLDTDTKTQLALLRWAQQDEQQYYKEPMSEVSVGCLVVLVVAVLFLIAFAVWTSTWSGYNFINGA